MGLSVSVTEQDVKPVCGPACLCAFTPQGDTKRLEFLITLKQVNCSNCNVGLWFCMCERRNLNSFYAQANTELTLFCLPPVHCVSGTDHAKVH